MGSFFFPGFYLCLEMMQSTWAKGVKLLQSGPFYFINYKSHIYPQIQHWPN